MSYTFAYYASAIAPNGEAVGKKTNKALTHCVVGRKGGFFLDEPSWRPVAWSTSIERAHIRVSSARSQYDELAIVEVELWNLNN